jgi:FlaA1/EpsC-like NDP-sugar epimerase
MVARKECEPGEIVIEEIGKRRGEKLYEELLTDEDVEYTKDNGSFLIIDTNTLGESQLGTDSYTSDSAKKLTIDQISQILEEVGY